MIAAKGVCVKAGNFQLRDVTFEIPSGMFGVVVGAAGSGKTTLLEAIAGVRAMSNGTITLHTHDVSGWPAERRSVGLVYQRGALFPHRSVRDNINWSAGSNEIVDDVVRRLGIGTLSATPVQGLSGGERQLVALARALVRVRSCQSDGRKPVLLLDEPFSALDPRRRVRTREVVHEFHREWSLTTLQVTHDGLDARRADVAVLLDSGSVVQSGNPEQMLRSPVNDDVSLFFQTA